MRAHVLLLGVLVSSAACGPRDLPRDEIKGILFPDKGVLGGYDFGDSWSDIKAKHPDHLEVRDDSTKQLRRDVGDNAGSNGYFLGFSLDPSGKVIGLEVSIHGQKQNTVAVRELFDEVVTHYDKTLGKGQCEAPPGGMGSSDKQDLSLNCEWMVTGKPQVRVRYMHLFDSQSGSLSVSVKPPK